MDLRITDRPVGGTTHVVEPHGEIDLTSALNLKAKLDAAMAAGARYVVVDLEDVPFLDSMGICVLLAPQRRLRARGGKLIVVCTDPLVRRAFEITGLTGVLNVTRSRGEALSAVQECAAVS